MIDKDTFKRECARMMDSVRDDEHKGGCNCDGVKCALCPLRVICGTVSTRNIFNAFETIEAVEEWSKKHPVVTMEEKFEETFGTKPIDPTGNDGMCCPRRLGFNVPSCSPSRSCYNCKNAFWGSEYKEPKKE